MIDGLLNGLSQRTDHQNSTNTTTDVAALPAESLLKQTGLSLPDSLLREAGVCVCVCVDSETGIGVNRQMSHSDSVTILWPKQIEAEQTRIEANGAE